MKLAIVDDNKLEQELIFNTLRTYEHERNISLDISSYSDGNSFLNTYVPGDFDLIFMDPPYHQGFEKQSVGAIVEKGLLAEGGKIVVESAADTDIGIPHGFRVLITMIYRATKFTLLTREQGECE